MWTHHLQLALPFPPPPPPPSLVQEEWIWPQPWLSSSLLLFSLLCWPPSTFFASISPPPSSYDPSLSSLPSSVLPFLFWSPPHRFAPLHPRSLLLQPCLCSFSSSYLCGRQTHPQSHHRHLCLHRLVLFLHFCHHPHHLMLCVALSCFLCSWCGIVSFCPHQSQRAEWQRLPGEETKCQRHKSTNSKDIPLNFKFFLLFTFLFPFCCPFLSSAGWSSGPSSSSGLTPPFFSFLVFFFSGFGGSMLCVCSVVSAFWREELNFHTCFTFYVHTLHCRICG